MPSKDAKDLCADLQRAWPKILTFYETFNTGYTLILTATHRPPEEQFELFLRGRKASNLPPGFKPIKDPWTVQKPDFTIDYRPQDQPTTFTKDGQRTVVTNCDGFIKKSKHNEYPSLAMDVAVKNIKTGEVLWDEDLYLPLGEIAEELGLTWGGDWKSIKDYPHFEV